ncbi:P2Y purinoceptor 1-like [Toxotes jaculatrix]|uniref:P2Y purinoceptor 1-like n=1 Tax=Toxotes jaculatrix TaxID=941984 RepID=UPI001B3AA09B|nr:P2Y purinoceptor 1-like [Toxotes jaculatrix]
MFILISGLVANATLLWLFLRERKSFSASKVLGLNLVVMDLIYLFTLPVDLIYDIEKAQFGKGNDSAPIQPSFQSTQATMDKARDIFSMFNLIGCPLLLACMCIERYLAVMRPVLYMRVRNWEYRMAVSAVVWAITLSFCLLTFFVADITIIMMAVSVIISCLFFLMLASLGGVVWSLWQQSPAHSTHGNQRRPESPQKRQAVDNVLAVVVPAVISYLPVLVMFPLVLYIYYVENSLERFLCNVLKLSVLFPSFGVLIGPLFYLSKARKMCCLSGTEKTFNE